MLYIRKALMANPYVRKFYRQYPRELNKHEKQRVWVVTSRVVCCNEDSRHSQDF